MIPLIVMAGLVPAIRRSTLPQRMAGTRAAMTMKMTSHSLCDRSDVCP